MASTVGDVGAAAGAGAAGGSSSSGGGGGGVPTIAQYATQAAAASDSKSVAEVVNAAINDPHIFVFGELLAVAKVQAVCFTIYDTCPMPLLLTVVVFLFCPCQLAGTEFEKVVDALKTFAYGTIDDVIGTSTGQQHHHHTRTNKCAARYRQRHSGSRSCPAQAQAVDCG